MSMIKVIGVLKTDDVAADLQQTFGCYPDMFKKLFLQVAPHLKFKIFDVTKGEKPDPIEQCDGYIITGSKAGVYESQEHPWINELMLLIRDISEAGVPQAGICFGHQALAVAFGGKVVKSSKGWGVGVHNYSMNDTKDKTEKTEKIEKIGNLNDCFSIIATHQDQVVEKPEEAQLLASSDFCAIAALISYERNFISFQGHPEFSKEYFLKLMDKRLTKIGKENIQRARQTIDTTTDADSVAVAILDFFSKQIASNKQTAAS